MNLITRKDVIKRIAAVHPEVKSNTIHKYIDTGLIKHSKKSQGIKYFSPDYIDKIIACIKIVIDWKKVEKIGLDK